MVIRSVNKDQIVTKNDWFSNYELQEEPVEFIFDNKEEQILIIDKLLTDLINRPKTIIFFYDVINNYLHKDLIYIEGVGGIKKEGLEPVCSYIENLINKKNLYATKENN